MLTSAAIPVVAAGPRRPARPWRDVGYAACIVLAGTLVGTAFVLAVMLAGRLCGVSWTEHDQQRIMILTIGVINATWLVLVISRARRSGAGSLGAALAVGPMRRHWLVVLVLAGEVGLAAYNVATLRTGAAAASAGMDPQVVDAAREGPFWLTLFLLEFTILTAVAEEVLFRGWLWTTLRRCWGVLPTALVTGGMFWLLHGLYGVHQFLLTLPVVIILTAVRHCTGSIRGTILLHCVQNAGAAVLTLLVLH